MFRSAFTLFFLIFIRCLTSQAATFIVISNADSGPGTLRQALLDAAANGSAEKDYIVFNIADQSEAGRTIRLASNLPQLSSNLEIDGSTQIGLSWGQSGARVKITTPVNNDAYTIFKGVGISNVGIFGLYFHDYSGIITSRFQLQERNGVVIEQSTNVVVGDVGRGNLLRGFKTSTFSFKNTDFVSLKCNVVGLGKDNNLNSDDAPYNSDSSAPIYFSKCNNINIGGELHEANFIFSRVIIGLEKNSTNNSINIKSNNFNVFQNGKTISFSNQDFIPVKIFTEDLIYHVASDWDNGAVVDINMENNLAGNYTNAVVLDNLKGTTNIYGNHFGISRDGTVNLMANSNPNTGVPIQIKGSLGQFNIGGDNALKGNVLANSIYMAITSSDSPNIFIRHNQYKCMEVVLRNLAPLPQVSINKIERINLKNHLTGTASAGATIDIYSSGSCGGVGCGIDKYIATTVADNAGNWQIGDLVVTGNYYVSATVNNRTSLFKSFEINTTDAIVQHLRCDKVGSVKGLRVPAGVDFHWIDLSGNMISNDLDLKVDKPGDYRLILGDGCIKSDWYKIEDKRLNIYSGFATKTNVSCGNNMGGIKDLVVYDPLNRLSGVVWTDANGNNKGNTADISGLPPGVYTLTARSSDGCFNQYVLDLTAPNAPQISSTPPAITNTPCGQSTGSVIGLGVSGGTGTLTYSWKNAAGQQVSPLPYLTGQRAGRYTLTVTDAAGCTAESAAFTILETNGITLNDNGQPTQPDCDGNLGKITGITATGATSYRWYNVITNQTVATTANASNLQPGTYRLEASNGNGCSQTSTTYTINTPGNNEFYGIVSSQKTPATCGLNNGSITVIFTDPTAVRPKSVRWAKQGGNQNLGSAYTIGNLDAGNYDLYATAQNGCEKLLGGTFVVDRIPGLSVDVTAVNVKPDECGLNNGSITGINVSQATSPVYTWTNASGQVVGNTLNLINKPVGTYTLKIQDGACQQTLPAMSIGSSNAIIQQPDVKDLQLCGGGDVLLAVLNPSSQYMYRLYDDAFSSTPIGAQASGQFKVKAESSRSYYISKYKGNCESARAELRVTVGSIGNQITNAFTPNNDGVNDTWRINNIENYPNALIQIFNRHGNKVFQSTGYTRPFDGSYQGRVLPAGVYYYIINLNTGCKVLTGSVTLLR